MSNIVVTNLAQRYAMKELENFLKEYNSKENEELTQKGRRELLEFALFMAFMAGYNALQGSNKDLFPS